MTKQGSEPDVGDLAPDFEGDAGNGRRVSLKDYRGKYLVLYFFPKAFTPGCRREAIHFRDNHEEIRALGADVVGVSIDDPTVQCEFAKVTAAPFPMVGDQAGAVSRAYGTKRKMLPFDRRVTFVVDPEGRIAARFEHEFRIERHVDDVLEFLKSRAQSN
jgi:thioredoxin-dependent peroxiredoxin